MSISSCPRASAEANWRGAWNHLIDCLMDAIVEMTVLCKRKFPDTSTMSYRVKRLGFIEKGITMKYEQVIQLYIQAKTSGRKPIRANTLEGYLSAIRCHLSPKWSGRELESITADELQEWVDSFSKAGAARKAFGTFRQVYQQI